MFFFLEIPLILARCKQDLSNQKEILKQSNTETSSNWRLLYYKVITDYGRYLLQYYTRKTELKLPDSLLSKF